MILCRFLYLVLFLEQNSYVQFKRESFFSSITLKESSVINEIAERSKSASFNIVLCISLVYDSSDNF